MFESQLKCRCHSGTQKSQFFLTESKPHFSPDRLVDVEHIKLELNVDLPQKMLRGTCTTSFKVVAPNVSKVAFDAIDLRVEQVLDSAGGALRFHQSDTKLTIDLGKTFGAGEETEVVIRYWVQEPRAGLYFITPDKNEPKRPWQLWTQGQDEDNRYWFPCHDSPNEKATTEMVVTVDETFTAISNGKLLNVTHDAAARRRTFHFLQSIPHASYLVTLCVGEFVELKDTSWKNSKGEEVPVLYYTLAGRERETKHCFGKTPKMMEFFSKVTGQDYPYEKYAQVVAWDFIYGGMENTSSTTQTEYTLHPESLEQDYSSEPLVAHELAHQWFGDLLTCKDWRHAWLNEGFATYFESVWTEFEHGKDEFLYELSAYEKTYKEEDGGAYRRPIVTNVYLRPSDLFDRHLYEKGGRVLHMLRRMLGEEAWWAGIRQYVASHAGQTVETVDLQRALEGVSGRSLDWFFEQWVFKAGHPDVKASVEWLDDRKQLKLTIAQTQEVNETTPLFRFVTRFKIVTADGEVFHDLEITKADQSFWFDCSEKPRFVSLNCENTVLGNWDVKQDRDSLVRQLNLDSDVMGRVAAARALGKDHSRQSVDALGAALTKEKFWGVQAEIAAALGAIGSPLALEQLARGLNEARHPKARRALMLAAGGFRNERSAEIAERTLREDSSPLVQFAAAQALGQSRTVGAFDKLNSVLGKRESWHDYHDCGVLMGLAELKTDERVLSILLNHTKPGKSMFVRRTAIEALQRYASGRPSLAVEHLIDLTKDTNYFVRLFSIHALEALGDDKAVSALARITHSVVEPRTARAALVAMKTIREGRTPNEALEKLRADFDRLRAQYSEVLGRLEKLEKPSESERTNA